MRPPRANGLSVQAGGATSSGPAAGTGLEMILQGFNWESYRNNWYKVCQQSSNGINACSEHISCSCAVLQLYDIVTWCQTTEQLGQLS